MERFNRENTEIGVQVIQIVIDRVTYVEIWCQITNMQENCKGNTQIGSGNHNEDNYCLNLKSIINKNYLLVQIFTL